MNLYKYLLLSMIAILTIGCSTYPTVEYPKRLSKKSVKEFKNYKLHKKSIAFVGQPIFRIKHEAMIEYQMISAKPLNSFTIKYKGNEYIIDNSTPYNVSALIELDGTYHKLINLNPEATLSYQDNFMILDANDKLVQNRIWSDGSIHNAVFVGSTEFVLKPVKVNLPDYASHQKILNIELLYNGTNKDGIKLLYREYTSGDMARPAFYQNLIYDTNEKEIRFKNFLIKVHSSNNQEIVYTILRDDFKSDTILIK